MATVFLTGGTGFIGSHLAEALVARGHTVRALVRSEPKWLEGVGVEVVQGSLSDIGVLWEAVQGVDYAYHVAGLTRAEDEEAFEKANVRATLNLLGAVKSGAPDVKRVLIVSSLAAVGRCDRTPPVADEASPLDPISRYGASKARMERALDDPQQMTQSYRDALPITVVRPPAVYGPREADIFTFFQMCSKGVCPVVGDPFRRVLSLVHVRDLVAGMIAAAESPEAVGETFFLGSPRVYSWAEVRDATREALGRRMVTVRVPRAFVGAIGAASEAFGKITGTYPALNREKARELRRACTACSSAHAHQTFGYAPSIDLEEGIAETIAWYRANDWL
jgi:nucleoside-diphosphate-sugar epimerase